MKSLSQNLGSFANSFFTNCLDPFELLVFAGQRYGHERPRTGPQWRTLGRGGGAIAPNILEDNGLLF